jgi:tetraacyldisaccharide 4'-kinase
LQGGHAEYVQPGGGVVELKNLLLPLTPLYGTAVRARSAAYRRGWLKTHRLGVPVVSVGNLTFGGTGKTPTVVALVRDLVRRGHRPAVLTRGYGRREQTPVVVVGPDSGHGPERTGDEPFEMASRLPGVPIVVDADRVRGGAEAVRIGADVVVLDDGFQHLRLARSLDLVLVDAGDPWGGGRLPPRGRLREPRTALKRATALLVTKVSLDHESTVVEIAAEVTRLGGKLPVLAARLVASRVRGGEGWSSPEALAGRRVLAFAGVGRPQGFADLLCEAGAEVVGTRWFRDHHRYSAADLDLLQAVSERLDATPVTTTKDAVKLPADAPVWVLEAEMTPVEGSWNALWALLPELTS